MFNSCQRKPGTPPVHIYQWSSQQFAQWCLSVSVRELCVMSAVLIAWRLKESWGWRKQSCWCTRKHFQSITPRVDIIRVKLLPPSAGYIASFLITGQSLVFTYFVLFYCGLTVMLKEQYWDNSGSIPILMELSESLNKFINKSRISDTLELVISYPTVRVCATIENPI